MNDAIRREMLALLPRLRRFAYGLTGSSDEGDDLVQATCGRAIGRIETWEPGTRLDSWMYRIARNSHFNRSRAKRVRGEHLQLVDWDRDLGFDGEWAMGTVTSRLARARMTLKSFKEGADPILGTT